MVRQGLDDAPVVIFNDRLQELERSPYRNELVELITALHAGDKTFPYEEWAVDHPGSVNIYAYAHINWWLVLYYSFQVDANGRLVRVVEWWDGPDELNPR